MRQIATEGDSKIIAIGDIHGQAILLKKMIAELEKNFMTPRTSIVFMGDYIDRSPNPQSCEETLQLLQAFERKYPMQTFLLKGNHEAQFLDAIDTDGEIPQGTQPWEFEIYKQYVPFFRSLLPYYETHDTYFAHAGGVIEGTQNLARGDSSAQEKQALYWTYSLPDVNYGKTVVRAHRIVDIKHAWGKYTVNTDLGSYKTGRLGAFIIQDRSTIMVVA